MLLIWPLSLLAVHLFVVCLPLAITGVRTRQVA